MKKLILSLFVVLLGATSAMGQIKTSPSYSEVYEKGSGKLRAKEWIMPDKMRVESYDPNGKCTIMIFRADSAKIYTQIGNGSWLAIPLSSVKAGTFMGGSLNLTGNKSKRTHRGQETVEGYDCNHYYVETATSHENGTTSYSDKDEWVYEPYNMVIQESDMVNPGGYLVRRNIKLGTQPASMFELPKDYNGGDLPLGGIMEILGGTKKSDKQGTQKKTESKEADVMNSLLEMMGGAKKK